MDDDDLPGLLTDSDDDYDDGIEVVFDAAVPSPTRNPEGARVVPAPAPAPAPTYVPAPVQAADDVVDAARRERERARARLAAEQAAETERRRQPVGRCAYAGCPAPVVRLDQLRVEFACSDGCRLLLHYPTCVRTMERSIDPRFRMKLGGACMTPDCTGRGTRGVTVDSAEMGGQRAVLFDATEADRARWRREEAERAAKEASAAAAKAAVEEKAARAAAKRAAALALAVPRDPVPYRPPLAPPPRDPAPLAPVPPPRDPVPYRPPLAPPPRDPVPYRPPLAHPMRDPVPYRPPLAPPMRDPVPYRPPLAPPLQDPVPHRHLACVTCRRNTADFCFVPCGHRGACLSCQGGEADSAGSEGTCPSCHVRREMMRIILS